MANPEEKKEVRTRIFSTNNKRSGFTMIELLFVIALVALLAGSAGAYYLRTHARLQVARCARQLALTIRYARILAVETTTNVDLILDRSKGSLCLKMDVFDEEFSEKQGMIVSNQYCRPVTFPENITFESLWKIELRPSIISQFDDEQASIISFYPDGTSDTLIAQIGDGENHYTLTLFSAGRGPKIKFGPAEDIKLPFIDLDMQDE